MNKSHVYLPILLAGLLAAAGVRAQSAPTAGSSDLPPKAGEASTQTMGAPNAKTSNAPSTGRTDDQQGRPHRRAKHGPRHCRYFGRPTEGG